MTPTELHYKIHWRARSPFPGHHLSHQKGGGLQLSNLVPLQDAPDPRRFDVRASLRDPFEQIQVRVYRQSSAIPVYVVADLSASMQFGGPNPKYKRVADFVASMSYSASRTGDPFGFVGCGDAKPILLPPTTSPIAGRELADGLRAAAPTGRSADTLRTAAQWLGSRRALVFLLSDFHFSSELLTRILNAMAYHDVVPVVFWDRNEYETLPDFGFARFTDPETGRSRLLLMRPALKERIRREFAARQQRLFSVFAQFGRRPLLLQDRFVPDEVTHYFFG